MFAFQDVQLKPKSPNLDLLPLKWCPEEGWTSKLLEHSEALPNTITLLTFNVMKEKIHLEERVEALTKLITQHKPHFIAIQENTYTFNCLLQESEVMKKNYYVNPFDGQGPGFRTSILSVVPPIRLTKVDLNRSRVSVIGVYNWGDEVFVVGSAHLTSGNNVNGRRQEIEKLQKELLERQGDTYIAMGDFNTNKSEETLSIEKNGFKDLWLILGLHPQAGPRLGKFRI
eukprot:TRINITY_DN6066_c0_g1_i6.p1 TRINITY_DN6066_c0_g1~~TRINITY_DN6066_c0_g1_i6.p1  ORF type:complete len:228 (+),score=42.38 TRINITY_DN6066_c0_g1_i6:71-754(+)